MKIIIENQAVKKDIEVIKNGLSKHNQKFFEPDNYQALQVFLKDDNNKVLGGVLGGTYWNWLVIDRFWISKEMRGKSYGNQLLQSTEDEAIKRGCKNAHLDTHDFQAVEFYKKNGYVICGQLDDLPEGSTRYLMKKQLISG